MTILFVIGSCLIAFLYLAYTTRNILRHDRGNEKMREIGDAISQGASAFMKREFRTMAVVLLLVAIFVFFVSDIYESLFFLLGAGLSALTGFLGMKIATATNVRAAAAVKNNFAGGFQVAFSAGAVVGMLVVSLGLLGIVIVANLTTQTGYLIGYAFGSSLVALFLRVGGGIYTKSADVGADLVGKVEQGIPEDDYRNPATIADNVGDNVGDIAGMGSDLFESYVSAIVAAMILGLTALGRVGFTLPLLLAAVGIISSLFGLGFVRVGAAVGNNSFEIQTTEVRKAMTRGVIVSNLLMLAASWFVIKAVVGSSELFLALAAGMVVGFIIGKSTEYYTSADKRPTQSIVEAASAGSPPNLIAGLSVGMISTAVPVIAVAAGTMLAFYAAGLFGIAIASVGILAVLGINLSMDSYGPVADNAAGISEMAGLGEEVRRRSDALDSVGNTTAAIGKGFAIGSAALAALAWVATFFHQAGLGIVSLIDVKVIVGLFVGAMISFVFSALLIKAVGTGSRKVVEEVRRQFREIPGILEGKTRPDYNRCVDITTKEALNRMIAPGALVVGAPLVVGAVGGVEAVGGLLVGALVTGFLLAIFMANAGGAWDNAKKFIEAGRAGGKGSPAHKVAVIGDTVGDPLKDTAGPSLNILIKLIGKIAVVAIPLLLLF